MRQLNDPPSCFERRILFDQFFLFAPWSDVGNESVGYHGVLLARICCSKAEILRSVLFFCATTLFFSKTSRETLSCRLAPLTTSDKGTPFSSTSRCRFVPFFSPICRVGADGFLRKRRLDVRPRRQPPRARRYLPWHRIQPPHVAICYEILPPWPTAEIFDGPLQMSAAS